MTVHFIAKCPVTLAKKNSMKLMTIRPKVRAPFDYSRAVWTLHSTSVAGEMTWKLFGMICCLNSAHFHFIDHRFKSPTIAFFRLDEGSLGLFTKH